MGLRRRLFVGCYAASGAAALIYEVTWTRLFTLQMGHTVAAASTVLAAFMGGLAIGAWIAGRVAASPTRRLQSYAVLELLVALIALALPTALRASVPTLSWAYADGDAPARFAIIRLTLSLALLGVPAAAMGATFPIAAAWIASTKRATRPESADTAAAGSGLLYAANTSGAALGAIAAGFWLIPAIGIRHTTWAGIILNVAAAMGALWVAGAEGAGAIDALDTRAGRKTTSLGKRAPALPGLACAAAAFSGFIALVYEVAWTRILALVLGPTTYAFATMAAAFITGIAIGSAIGARLARRVSYPAIWLAGTLVLVAVAGSFAGWFAASRLPLIVAAEVADPGVAFGPVILRQAFRVALLLFPMTFAFGAAFPLALETASTDLGAAGRDAARVYAANTAGAIAGALAGGFVLVPALGLQGTFVQVSRLATIAGGLVAMIAIGQHATGRRRARVSIGAMAVASVALALIVSLPEWDRQLLVSGAYKYAPYMRGDDLDVSLRAGRLEYYKEGAAATVSVRRLAGTVSLAIDGKVDASNGGDMLTQRLLALLPAVLHRDPRDFCIIGLGSGVTLGTALASGGVRHADVVEISPEVVEASAFFERENGGALGAPGVRLIVGDGRSHLLLSRQRYDVIVSEPSNPWIAGVAALFTREFFEAARARLKPDGLLCQWAHTYDMSPDDLKSIVRTFASVFPQGSMWLVGDGDLLLIGTTGASLDPHLDGLARRLTPAIAEAALPDVAITPAAAPFALLSLFAGGPDEIREYADGAIVQTDDRMSLEFSAPRGIYGRLANQNTAAIRALRDRRSRPAAVASALADATDESWLALGNMELAAQGYSMAYTYFQRAAQKTGRNADALRGMSDAAAGSGRQAEERTWLERLAASEPTNEVVRLELSRVLAAAGEGDAAIRMAVEAGRLAPADARPAEQLASIFADLGDADRLTPLADALVARFPDRADSRYYHATALFLRGRAQEAAEEARHVIASNPRHAKAQNLLGAACATLGDRSCAQAAFDVSLGLNPRDPAAYVNIGLLRLQAADASAAADYFNDALALDPASTAARNGLAQARLALEKR